MWSTKNTRTGQTGSLLRLREVWSTGIPPPHPPPLSHHRCSPPSPRGEAEREQRDRVLKHRQHRPARKRIESKIGQPRANRLIAEFSSRQFHPSTSWESVRSLESRATRDFSPPRMDARVAPSFAKIWPSDKLVRGRISWPPLRYSNAIFLLFFTWWWFVTMGVGFRGILLLEIVELKYGCWVLFRNEIFLTVFWKGGEGLFSWVYEILENISFGSD